MKHSPWLVPENVTKEDGLHFIPERHYGTQEVYRSNLVSNLYLSVFRLGGANAIYSIRRCRGDLYKAISKTSSWVGWMP